MRPAEGVLFVLLAVLGMIDREFDCLCCHGPEAHAIDPVRMERGKCLVPDCVHECQRYIQQKKSAFWEMMDLVSGLMNREEKRKALFAEEWSLEGWMARFRNTPWPEKGAKNALQ